jgi:hypothetical protein
MGVFRVRKRFRVIVVMDFRGKKGLLLKEWVNKSFRNRFSIVIIVNRIWFLFRVNKINSRVKKNRGVS